MAAPGASTLLGICIPVYKRPDLLAGCLDSAIESARPYRIPIFISDDSTDETNRAVIEHAARHYPYIHVSRNATNLGIDRNVGRCVELCTCTYAWMIGEDDRFRREGVATVLQVLETAQDMPFAFVNYTHVSADYKTTHLQRRLPLAMDTEVGADEFLRRWAWASGFIGGCVVDVRWWRETAPDPFLGTWFAHVGRIMTFSAGKRVRVIAQPLVLNRAGNFSSYTWGDRPFEVFYGFERMLESLAGIYGRGDIDAALASCRTAFRHRSLKWLILTRAEYAYDMAVYRKYELGRNASLLFRALAHLIALSPVWMSRLVRLIGRDIPRAVRSRSV